MQAGRCTLDMPASSIIILDPTALHRNMSDIRQAMQSIGQTCSFNSCVHTNGIS